MNKIIKFFLENEKLNYFLFVMLIIIGINTYNITPKEIFPDIKLDKISITGSYPGASIDNLNKMAVIDIEDELTSITGLKDVKSTIKPGSFSISGDIENRNPKDVLDDVERSLKTIKQNLPSDMNEPTVVLAERKLQLLDITVSSKLEGQDLIAFANKIKTRLSSIKYISEIIVYGDSDKHILLQLDEGKINSYGLNISSVVTELKSLSYVFPLGMVEESGSKSYYLNAFNGKKEIDKWEETLLQIGDKKIYLSEIVNVSKKYKDTTSISTLNAKKAVILRLNKSESGNALDISKEVRDEVEKVNEEYKNYKLEVFLDTSTWIRERLDVVMSNIALGILLVVGLMYILINKRMALVVLLGLPTAFLIGTIIFAYLGNTINMISLLGVLIALGVLVDDAIIVSENIQRHLEEGKDKATAAYEGTKEVALPVVIASLTTLFAFFPMLMLSGEVGTFIYMIPVAVIILIFASVIESFLFLPLHAKHILNKDDKERDWSWFQNFYKNKLTFFIKWKKSSLVVFLIGVPLLMVIALKSSNFQFFPKFNSNNIYITAKMDVNYKLEDSYRVLKDLELKILEGKKSYGIKNTTGKAGYRMTKRGTVEYNSNLVFIVIELNDLKPMNFVDEYITPYLSLYYDPTNRTRERTSQDIAAELEVLMKKYKKESKESFIELVVVEDSPGIVAADVYLSVSVSDDEKLNKTLKILKDKLYTIEGLKDISDNADLGVSEIKLKLNNYGEKLGLTETYISRIINDNFLGNKKSTFYDKEGIFDIVIESKYKDKLEQLETLMIPLKNGSKVRLEDVVSFINIDNYEKMEKEDGENIKIVMANVRPEIITATDVLKKINPLIEKLNKEEGIKIKIKGEAEKKKDLLKDMKKAFSLALILIMISLLFMFNSFLVSLSIISVIPLSFLGVLIGHFIMGMNLSMPSIIGGLGLAGVVINDGIIMLTFLEKAKTKAEILTRAAQRLRPIILTSVTTFIGLVTLIFFATGQAVIMQPLAVSLGFGLIWGTILNLYYIPVLYAIIKNYK